MAWAPRRSWRRRAKPRPRVALAGALHARTRRHEKTEARLIVPPPPRSDERAEDIVLQGLILAQVQIAELTAQVMTEEDTPRQTSVELRQAATREKGLAGWQRPGPSSLTII